jgi:hypothetical protein
MEPCHDWLVDNKLSFYLGKTDSAIFGPKSKLLESTIASYVKCINNNIAVQNCIKYLVGVIDINNQRRKNC